MKSAVFWDVTPCGSLRTDVSEEHIASIISVESISELGTTLAVSSNRTTLRRTIENGSNSMGYKRDRWRNEGVGLCSNVRQLLVTANSVPSSPILSTLMMVMCSSETSVLQRSTGRHIPENDNLTEIVHRLGCDHFLPNPFRFINLSDSDYEEEERRRRRERSG
jgi:hypothetical protein